MSSVARATSTKPTTPMTAEEHGLAISLIRLQSNELTPSFGEQYSTLVRERNDAWRTGENPAPPNLAMAQRADDFVAAVEELGFSEGHRSAMAAFVSAFGAYARYTRDHGDVILSDRDEPEAPGVVVTSSTCMGRQAGRP